MSSGTRQVMYINYIMTVGLPPWLIVPSRAIALFDTCEDADSHRSVEMQETDRPQCQSIDLLTGGD